MPRAVAAQAATLAAVFDRYLAVDSGGVFALVLKKRAERFYGSDVILLERTTDWAAALRAHRELEALLHEADPREDAAKPASAPALGPRARV